MQNIKLFIDAGVKFDKEFMEIINRADRTEMCKYRNAIIDERKRRQNSWQKLKTEKRRGDLKDFWMSVFEIALVVFDIVAAITLFRDGGTVDIFLGILFMLLAISAIRRAAYFYLKYRGIEITLITAEQMKAEMAESSAEAGTKYAALRKDSDEVLKAKQNRLDSLLGL